MVEFSADYPWLSIITFLPLLAILPILLRRITVRDDEAEMNDHVARSVALIATGMTFLLSVFVYYQFYDQTVTGYQLVETLPWLADGVTYKMGVDGISILFVLLTTFFMPICILASWRSIKARVTEYMIAFLILESLMIGVFCALDLVLFYVFFEASLIPMFILIGVWGSKGEMQFLRKPVPTRIYASFKFFLYTLLGSLLMLIAIIWIYNHAGTTDIPSLQFQVNFPEALQNWLWLAFFASFAVKMPMWPVHTWLPDAHVQAPTAASVVLAAILLKMGGYGFVRFSLPMFPLASADFAPLIFILSVIAIVYTSFVAFAQEDMKKLIAYSSVAHMGFVTMGLFTANAQGVEGALFQMLSHGFISGALFLCVGIVYDRMHTREIAAYGGLVKRMKIFAFFFLLFSMANVGLPGLSGFIGEILTLIGAFQVNSWVAAGAALGVILSACYGLRLYREVVFGEIANEKLNELKDMEAREIVLLSILAVMTLYLGVNPSPTLAVFSPAVEAVLVDYASANAGR